MAQRKIPMRKDIVTGEMVPKKELVRVVKNKEGEVSIDPSGKKSGRGAYIHLNVDVAKKAKVDKTFDKTFGISISDDFYDELIASAKKHFTEKEVLLIKKAYLMAKELHQGQKRNSGRWCSRSENPAYCGMYPQYTARPVQYSWLPRKPLFAAFRKLPARFAGQQKFGIILA